MGFRLEDGLGVHALYEAMGGGGVDGHHQAKVGGGGGALKATPSICRKIDPAKLYCINEHQMDIAKQVKRAGGRKLKIEAHGGARRRTAKDIEAAQYDSSDGERE